MSSLVSSYQAWLGSIIFLVTWLFMAFKLPFFPIGRVLGTLSGALLCILVGVLNPEDALLAINLETITLLFGTMIMTILVEREGFFKYVLDFLVWKCVTAQALLIRVCVITGFLAALVTNDTVCVFLTPIVVELCERYDLPHGPFLLALATSANVGSTSTPVGNPQNMIIATLSGIPFSTFVKVCGLSCVVCLTLNILMLLFLYKDQLVGIKVSSSNATFIRANESDEHIQRINEAALKGGILGAVGLRQTRLDSDEWKHGEMKLNEKAIAKEANGKAPEDIPLESLASDQQQDEKKKQQEEQMETNEIVEHERLEEQIHQFQQSQSQPQTADDDSKQLTEKDASGLETSHIDQEDGCQRHSVSLTIPATAGATHRLASPLLPGDGRPLIVVIEELLRVQHTEFLQKFGDLGSGLVDPQATSKYSEKDEKQQQKGKSADNENAATAPLPIRRAHSSVRAASFGRPRQPHCELIMVPPSIPYLLSTLPASIRNRSSRRSSVTGPDAPWWKRVACLRWTHRVCRRYFGRKLSIFCFILFGTIVAFIAGAPLHWAAVCGAAAMLLVDAREPDVVLDAVDWSLLVFFSALFIVVKGFQETGIPDSVWSSTKSYIHLDSASGITLFTLLVLVGSNTVSNVPLVLLLSSDIPTVSNPQAAWLLLSFISTVGGNLTLIGSVANLIVAARAKAHYQLAFFEYLKFGLPSTIIITIVGVLIICAVIL